MPMPAPVVRLNPPAEIAGENEQYEQDNNYDGNDADDNNIIALYLRAGSGWAKRYMQCSFNI